MKTNNMPQTLKGDWPFKVQVRSPGEQGAWWAQAEAAPGLAPQLDPSVFMGDDARDIAQALKEAAERNERRKAPAFQSAMSMLTLYLNRSGSRLPARQRACLEAAKHELRALYGRVRQGSAPSEVRARKGGHGGAPVPGARFVERRSAPAS